MIVVMNPNRVPQPHPEVYPNRRLNEIDPNDVIMLHRPNEIDPSDGRNATIQASLYDMQLIAAQAVAAHQAITRPSPTPRPSRSHYPPSLNPDSHPNPNPTRFLYIRPALKRRPPLKLILLGDLEQLVLKLVHPLKYWTQ